MKLLPDSGEGVCSVAFDPLQNGVPNLLQREDDGAVADEIIIREYIDALRDTIVEHCHQLGMDVDSEGLETGELVIHGICDSEFHVETQLAMAEVIKRVLECFGVQKNGR